MFTVGESYDFELMDDTDHEGRPAITTYPWREVLAVDGPLVKIAAGADSQVIINTHSLAFVRAKPRGKGQQPRGKFTVELTPPQKAE